jgi:hypothetical protein
VPALPITGSQGERIARWAPRAGTTPEERTRFGQAVDRWLEATGERPGRAASLARGRPANERGWSQQLGYFQSFNKARPPWDAADFEREAELASVDVDHLVGCPRPRPVVRELGRRVDGRLAGLLVCEHCGASLPLVDRRLDREMSGSAAASADVPPKDRSPLGEARDESAPDDRELTRERILAARRAWQLGGEHAHRALYISESTLMRHRHKLRLVPWPRGYEDRLAPEE